MCETYSTIMAGPTLADLIRIWIDDQGLTRIWKVTGDLIRDFHFGYIVAFIRSDGVEFIENDRCSKKLFIHMADPKLFPLLSNRLGILAAGFKKAKDSRRSADTPPGSPSP